MYLLLNNDQTNSGRPFSPRSLTIPANIFVRHTFDASSLHSNLPRLCLPCSVIFFHLLQQGFTASSSAMRRVGLSHYAAMLTGGSLAGRRTSGSYCVTRPCLARFRNFVRLPASERCPMICAGVGRLWLRFGRCGTRFVVMTSHYHDSKVV